MEQRRLRLGDILDDYCPRERRVTNHAVVAMIEEHVRQTRCTTCDAEHAYKGARVPRRRKSEAPAALYEEVLAGLAGTEDPASLTGAEFPQAVPVAAIPVTDAVPSSHAVARHPSIEEPDAPMHDDTDGHRRQTIAEPDPGERNGDRLSPRTHEEAAPSSDGEDGDSREGDAAAIDGPVHRRLIRATLPRPEGQKDARPMPEFTVRHAPPRANGHGNPQGSFRGERTRMRGGTGSGQGEPNGNRTHGNNAQRFQANRPGGPGRPPRGRPAGPSTFRTGVGGPKGKRGRGPRG